MTAWILTLALHSSPHGWYVKEFASEKACQAEMKNLIKSTKDNDDIKEAGASAFAEVLRKYGIKAQARSRAD